MLPKPQPSDVEGSSRLATLPWACLTFFLAYLLVMFTVQLHEDEQETELVQWYYSGKLFDLEWNNYISWLRINGMIDKATDVQAAHDAGDRTTVIRAMGFDEAFEEENRQRGNQYWSPQERIAWQQLREEFDQRASTLVRVRFGLNPSAPRPSTYLTWHFLHENIIQWLVALLVLAPFAWPLEAALGWKRVTILWFVSGIVIGLSYVAFMSGSYQPLVGSTPLASAMIGVFASLFALKKLPFVYPHPKKKALVEKELPAAIILPLWFVLPVYEFFGGATAPHAWIALVVGLVAGAILCQLAQRQEVAGIDDDEDEEQDDQEKALRTRLNSAWSSMSALAFAEAGHQFEAALEVDPHAFSALTGLYHVRKLKPEDPAFEEIALNVLGHETEDTGEIRQQFNLYRDYIKRVIDLDRLPEDVRTTLAYRFSLVEELREADKLGESVADSRSLNEKSLRTFRTLAEAFDRFGQPAKANHYSRLAERARKALA